MQCHKLRAILYLTLFQQCRNVVAGRVTTDAELLGDVLVGIPQQHQSQYFTFTRRSSVRSFARMLSFLHRRVLTSFMAIPGVKLPIGIDRVY